MLDKSESKSSSAFEKLTDKLENNAEASDSEVADFEFWISTFSSKLESLLEEINKVIDKLNDNGPTKKSDFSTFFKKQDPPHFKGDCLEYLEWKRR